MQQLLAAVDQLYEIFATGAVLVVCGLALACRDNHVRLAGVLQLADAFAIAMVASLLDPHDRHYLMDAKAFLVLAAYAAMTFRWPDRWLIVLTGLQGFAVLLHFSDWMDAAISWPVNRLLLNVTGWSMVLVLGAVAAIRLLPQAAGPGESSKSGCNQ